MLEIGERLPFPLVQPALNLQNQYILAPAILQSGPQVLFPCRAVLDPVQNSQIVASGQFCNELLQNLWLRPRLGQRAHVTEVARAEAFHSGKLCLQVMREVIDNLATPPLALEPLAKLASD